jgi:lambda family phage minor tail protein L
MPNKSAIKSQKITSELFGAVAVEPIELYTIHSIENEDSARKIRFHGGINELRTPVTFGGQEYYYIPYESSGFGSKADGSVTRPSLKIINIDGFVSTYAQDKNDLIGAKVKRMKTFLRFLDAENFLGYNDDAALKQEWVEKGIDPDPNALIDNEEWIIGRKINENRFFVEYELTSPVDLENVSIPRRKVINNYCFWKYRGPVCGYDGPPVADANDLQINGPSTDKGLWEPGEAYAKDDYVHLIIEKELHPRKVVYVCINSNTADISNKPSVSTDFWMADQCSKCLRACKMRFEGDAEEPLPFGGFPGSRIY